MATSEDENIYDALGTVLFCTVPVLPTAAEEETAPHELSDALNIPLDYETALAMLEAEQATSSQSGGASATGVSSGGGGSGGLLSSTGNGAAAGRSGGRASISGAADTAGFSAAGRLPAPPQQQPQSQPPRVGLSNMTARYGNAQRTAASVSFKGGVGAGNTTRHSLSPHSASLRRRSSSVGNPSRRSSRAGVLDDGAADTFDSVAARNAHTAKAASARAAAKSANALGKSTSTQGLKGTSVTTTTAAAAAAAARSKGGRALTVADAMNILFPIAPVKGGADGAHDAAGGQNSSGAQQSRKLSSSSTMTGTHRHSSGTVHTHEEENASHAHVGDGDEASDAPQLWRRADVEHVSRIDVVLLYLHLQRRATAESARPRGVVCPNRERLYGDALQELTRQVTLLCPERGLLLEELARSMQQSIETYDVLLDSASQYAVRKSTERDLHQHLFAEKAELETEVRRREHRVSEWRAKYAGMQKRLEEQQAADEKLHEQEIAYAKKANMQLVNEIKRLASEAEKAKEN